MSKIGSFLTNKTNPIMTFDANERESVQKLRNRVYDVLPADKLEDEHFLIRWLRARNMDLEDAELMLRKSMDWFYRNEMDIILDWKPRKNYYRYAMAGHDTEGCPVFLFPVGFWNLYEASDMGDIVPPLRFITRILAQIEKEITLSSQRLQKSVTQFVVVIDVQQFAYLRHLNNRNVVQAAIQFFQMFENNYPEMLKSCIVVNTSRLFPLIMTIIRPFLSGRTFSKLEVYGHQRRKWITALEKKVPMEILPPYYGGTRPGNDEYCSDSSMWNDDEPLPGHYYGIKTNNTRPNSRIELDVENSCFNTEGGAWKRQEIEAGSKIDLEFVVSQNLSESLATQILTWQIKSEVYDIGLKVTFRPAGQKLSYEVVEYHRIDSHLTTMKGSLLCDKQGTYTIVLDNSYSKRRSKIVSYNVTIAEYERRLSTA